MAGARNLDPCRIVAAGVALVKREGMGALTLRAVAADLAVTPMALYRHLPGGETLSSCVAAAFAAALPEVPRTGRVRSRLRRWAQELREALAGAPGFSHHLLLHWFELPDALERIEQLLAAVEEAGLRGFEAVAAANAVFTFVLMRVQLEEALREAGALRRTLSGLRKTRVELRRLQAHLREYQTAKTGAHFDYGLKLILDGIGKRRRR